jgi:hypothetical protein
MVKTEQGDEEDRCGAQRWNPTTTGLLENRCADYARSIVCTQAQSSRVAQSPAWRGSRLVRRRRGDGFAADSSAPARDPQWRRRE